MSALAVSSSPSEETLFNSGWKDDWGFFGGSDAHMTLPYTRRERNLLTCSEKSARGLSLKKASAIDDEEELDKDTFVPFELCFEERFLPNPAPTSLLSLPSYLRVRTDPCTFTGGYPSKVNVDEAIAAETGRKRSELLDWLYDYIFAIDPRKNPRFFSDMHRFLDPLLSLSELADRRLWLDYVPLIRCIARLDQAAEAAYRKMLTQDPDLVSALSNRKRRTRRSRDKGFGFYTEKLVPGAIWSDSDSVSVKDLVEALSSCALSY